MEYGLTLTEDPTCAVLEIDMVSTVESGALGESSQAVGEYPAGGQPGLGG